MTLTTAPTTRSGLIRPSIACIMPRVFTDKRQDVKSIATDGLIKYSLEAIRDSLQVSADTQLPRDIVATASQLSLRWHPETNRATLHKLGGYPDWTASPHAGQPAELLDGGMVFTRTGLRRFCAEILPSHGFAWIDATWKAVQGEDPKIRAKAIDLLNINIQLLARAQSGRMLQLRTVRTKDNGRIVRAVRAVFRDYTQLDDVDVVGMLLDCPDTRDLPVVSFRRGDDGMRLRFAMETDVAWELNQLVPMYELRNSETGHSSVHGSAIGFRPWCLNGLGTVEVGANVSWRHSGRASRVIDGLPQAYENARNVSLGLVERYNEAIDTAIDDAVSFMRSFLDGAKVGEETVDQMVAALSHETTTPGRMLASTIDAVTLVAQDQLDQLRQRELEVLGGQLLRHGLERAVDGRIA